MKIIALDLSLTSTGVAASPEIAITLVPPKQLSGLPRIQWIRDRVIGTAELHEAELVAIEGYAFGRPLGMAALGELGGVIRLALYEAGFPYIDVPPSSIKKYATGKGNSDKDAVLAAAIRRFEGFAGHSKDAADALWLYALVKDAIGEPVVTMPAVNREILKKVMELLPKRLAA